MSIRHFMKIVESQQLDELFGLRTGPKQSDLYPASADILSNDFEDNKMDLGNRFNFNRQMLDIEKHPDFVNLVNALEADENGNTRYDLRTEMDMCKGMARDLNHTTGQIHDYCSQGPWHRRHGSYDSSKWAPTDGPDSPYNDPESWKYDGDDPANDLPGVIRNPDGTIKYIPGVDD